MAIFVGNNGSNVCVVGSIIVTLFDAFGVCFCAIAGVVATPDSAAFSYCKSAINGAIVADTFVKSHMDTNIPACIFCVAYCFCMASNCNCAPCSISKASTPAKRLVCEAGGSRLLKLDSDGGSHMGRSLLSFIILQHLAAEDVIKFKYAEVTIFNAYKALPLMAKARAMATNVRGRAYLIRRKMQLLWGNKLTNL
ncbi:hypothetical protein GQX74_010264 [Glossina fuscipes]|nr:hypothetical protein GQX74_010264 [Glossina fuscipes]